LACAAKVVGDELKVELVTLVPMIVCLYAIYRWGTHGALLYVVLPTLLLLPTYYWLSLQPLHLPGIDFIDAALIPLLGGMLLFDSVRWRFTRTDLLVLVFIFTSGYANHRMGRSTDAAFGWFGAIITGLIPYMAGKLLIEQTGSRTKFCRIFVLLVAWSSVFSSIEYFFRRNPYGWLWNHFYPSQWSGWLTQVRWGFGRMAGPYSQSELAGQIILTAWLMALWMGRHNYQELWMRVRPRLPLQHGKGYIWALFVALFMTQARGPWIGAGLGLTIAAIGRARRPGMRSVIVLLLFLVVGVPGYVLGKDYIAGPRKNYGSEKETAQYRAELVSNYIPLAKAGGMWGWGQDFPRIGGQQSIDNEYLYSWIVQGSVGAVALIFLMLESVGRLLFLAWRARSVRELHFFMTMLGIVGGIAFTISTVFLGSQTYELLFLLIGWVQALQVSQGRVRAIPAKTASEDVKERELMMVYS
jgi:hypothetical protein